MTEEHLEHSEDKDSSSKPIKFENRESNDVAEIEKRLEGKLSVMTNYIKDLVVRTKKEKNPNREKKEDGTDRLTHEEVMKIIQKITPVIKGLNSNFSAKEREILVKESKEYGKNWNIFYTLSDEGDARPGGKLYDFGYAFEEESSEYSFRPSIGGPGDEGE